MLLGRLLRTNSAAANAAATPSCAAGFSQPIVLAVIAACVGGLMMFIYSGLLILINRKMLPEQIRIRGVRIGVLVWSVLLFGVLAVLTVQQQLGRLFGG